MAMVCGAGGLDLKLLSLQSMILLVVKEAARNVVRAKLFHTCSYLPCRDGQITLAYNYIFTFALFMDGRNERVP